MAHLALFERPLRNIEADKGNAQVFGLRVGFVPATAASRTTG